MPAVIEFVLPACPFYGRYWGQSGRGSDIAESTRLTPSRRCRTTPKTPLADAPFRCHDPPTIFGNKRSLRERISMSFGHELGAGLSTCGCGRCAVWLSRRQMLAAAAGGMLALLGARSATAQTDLSPDAALAQLMDGNARFVSGGLTSFDEDLAILKQKTVAKQEPFAAVLSCADSRVPVELVFDQSIGHVFVNRVA